MRLLLSCILFVGLILGRTLPVAVAADSWPSIYQNQTNTNITSSSPAMPLSLSYSVANQYIEPVIDENILVTARLSGTTRFITAYDATTGQSLWDFSLGKEIPRQPLILSGLIYLGVSTSSNIYAINLKTGKLTWKVTIPGERLTRHAPIAINNNLYIAGDKLHKLTATGTYQWTKSFDIESPLASKDATLYFRIHGQELISYNPETETENWRYFTNTTLGSHPVVSEDIVYVGLYGKFVAINRTTGKELWRHNTTSGRTKIGSITATKDYVLVGTNNGDITRLSPDGQIVWHTQYNTGDYQGNGWLSEFIVAGNVLVGRYNQLDTLLLDIASGSILSNSSLSITGITPVAVTEPHIYFTKDNTIAAYRSNTWQLPPPTAPSTPEKRPIIIIPGILESWPIFGQWKIDPIFGMFRNLFTALKDSGYREDELVFPFAYDWHKPNNETAERLQQFIQNVKQQTGSSDVDIIAHSMGGLVARSYIQSLEYRNDVHTLITIATPHHGATKAYLTWEAGEIGSTVIDTVAEKLIAYESRKNGYGNEIVTYLHEKVLALGELLPIYNYLRTSTTLLSYLPCNPAFYPCNPFLERLDSTLALLHQRVQHVNIIAVTSAASTLTELAIMPSPLQKLWQHGFPLLYPKEDGLTRKEGDTTVPLSSARLLDSQEIKLTADHVEAITEAIPAIIQTVTGSMPQSPPTPWQPPNKVLFIEWQGIGNVAISTLNGIPLARTVQANRFTAYAAEPTPPTSTFFEQEGERGVAIIPNPDSYYTLKLSDLQPTAAITTTIITDGKSTEQQIHPAGDTVIVTLEQSPLSPSSSPPLSSPSPISSPEKPPTSSLVANTLDQPTPPTDNTTSPKATDIPAIHTPSPLSSSVLINGTTSRILQGSSRSFYRRIASIFLLTFLALSLIFYRLHRADLPKD